MQINLKLWILVTLFLACSPTQQSGTASRKSASSSANNKTNITDTSDSDTSSTTRSNIPGSDVILDQDFLSKMTLAQVQGYYKARLEQLKNDKQDYSINDQIGNALCLRFQDLQKNCTSANTLTPIVSSTLNCGDGVAFTDFKTSPFSVLLTNSNGQALSSIDGKFILVANGNYKSDPFTVGPTSIKFTYQGASKSEMPIKLQQIYKLEIRRADEKAEDILNGTAKKMPPIESFFVQLSYKSVKLTDGALMDYEDPNFKNYRYRINLSLIFADAKSANCTVTPGEIDSIKTQIRNSIIDQDAQMSKKSIFEQSTTALPTKDKMIAQILDAQDKISALMPMLEDSRNRLLKLTNELRTDVTIGCHADEPILSMTIDIQGKRNDPKLLSDKYVSCPKVKPTGPGSVFSIQMGSSVSVSIDQTKYAIGGSPWQGAVADQVLVGDMEYLQIKKLGITIEDKGPVCKSGFLGASSSCAEVCMEDDIFSITSIKIAVDTPSQKAFTVYENKNLNLTFASTLYSTDSIVTWTAENFRSNQNWLNFMYDTNCDTTK